ncbi:hypothetical protein ACE193_06915 [Bernardetia sp. OM2101]|uniref:hypothetical protein n=1 Tax=Bernardetia sp. OM2101 TaxID=3344876 RepID=UPI0035CEEC7D
MSEAKTTNYTTTAATTKSKNTSIKTTKRRGKKRVHLFRLIIDNLIFHKNKTEKA